MSEHDLLSWDASGALPPGDHAVTLDALAASCLVTGGETPPAGWDRDKRSRLVANLRQLVAHLHQVGIDRIYLDGSFCTDKPSPGDIDGWFVTDFPSWRGPDGQARRLQQIDPTWTYADTDRLANSQGKLKWPQWFRYGIELFPVFDPPWHHLSFMGTDHPPTTIDDFFRIDARGIHRGVIQIIPAQESTP